MVRFIFRNRSLLDPRPSSVQSLPVIGIHDQVKMPIIWARRLRIKNVLKTSCSGSSFAHYMSFINSMSVLPGSCIGFKFRQRLASQVACDEWRFVRVRDIGNHLFANRVCRIRFPLSESVSKQSLLVLVHISTPGLNGVGYHDQPSPLSPAVLNSMLESACLRSSILPDVFATPYWRLCRHCGFSSSPEHWSPFDEPTKGAFVLFQRLSHVWPVCPEWQLSWICLAVINLNLANHGKFPPSTFRLRVYPDCLCIPSVGTSGKRSTPSF
jgi:hypothetical protein